MNMTQLFRGEAWHLGQCFFPSFPWKNFWKNIIGIEIPSNSGTKRYHYFSHSAFNGKENAEHAFFTIFCCSRNLRPVLLSFKPEFVRFLSWSCIKMYPCFITSNNIFETTLQNCRSCLETSISFRLCSSVNTCGTHFLQSFLMLNSSWRIWPILSLEMPTSSAKFRVVIWSLHWQVAQPLQ